MHSASVRLRPQWLQAEPATWSSRVVQRLSTLINAAGVFHNYSRDSTNRNESAKCSSPLFSWHCNLALPQGFDMPRLDAFLFLYRRSVHSRRHLCQLHRSGHQLWARVQQVSLVGKRIYIFGAHWKNVALCRNMCGQHSLFVDASRSCCHAARLLLRKVRTKWNKGKGQRIHVVGMKRDSPRERWKEKTLGCAVITFSASLLPASPTKIKRAPRRPEVR